MRNTVFKDFTLPFGRWTNPQYGAAAAGAFGGMVGSLANADATQRAAEAQAGGVRDAARYGAMGNAYGGYAGGLGGALNAYTGLLGNTAASASNAFNGLAGGIGSLGQSRASDTAARNNSYAGMTTGLGGVLGNLYGTLGGNLGALANAQSNESVGLANAYGGMQGSIANAIANAYGGYSSGLGGVANAMASEAGNRYNSNAMAEAARQAGLANVGSAALGAWGSAAGSALGAYGAAEAAYQNARGNTATANQSAVGGLGAANQAALAGLGSSRSNAAGQLGASNQQAISNIASSRNSALANLGSSYAGAGQGLGSTAMLGDIDLNFGGYDQIGPGGFSASGPDGQIASGAYSGTYSPGGMSFSANVGQGDNGFASVADRTFEGLGGLASQIDNQAGYGELSRSLAGSQAAIEDDRAYDELSRGLGISLAALQPGLDSVSSGPDYSFLSDTLNSTLSGLSSLSGGAYSSSDSGMDQFYRNQQAPTDYLPLLDRLDSSYRTAVDSASRGGRTGFSRSNYGGFRDDLVEGLGSSAGMLGSLADRGFGSVDNNRYRDGDLLGGLARGYGSSLDSAGRAASMGADAFAGTSGLLTSGMNATMRDLRQPAGGQAESVSGTVLQNLFNAPPEPKSPLKDRAKREYEALVAGGPMSRFDPYSPDYDGRAARELGRLSSIIRSGSVPSWSA